MTENNVQENRSIITTEKIDVPNNVRVWLRSTNDWSFAYPCTQRRQRDRTFRGSIVREFQARSSSNDPRECTEVQEATSFPERTRDAKTRDRDRCLRTLPLLDRDSACSPEITKRREQLENSQANRDAFPRDKRKRFGKLPANVHCVSNENELLTEDFNHLNIDADELNDGYFLENAIRVEIIRFPDCILNFSTVHTVGSWSH